MKETILKVSAAGSLLELLKSHFPDSSGSELKKWIAAGRLTIDGKKAQRVDVIVNPSNKVALLPRSTPKSRAIEAYGKLVYEDDYLIVIDKKCGILSVANEGGKDDSLHAAIKRHCHPHKIFVVHRLDRETSGLILFAKEPVAFQSLKEQLAQRTMGRRYLAVVAGTPTPDTGTWSSYLYEDKNLVVRTTKDQERGEHAVIHYKVVKSDGRHSLLELTLETGKKNQIRVHCHSAGIPIVGDTKYGGPSAVRMALHATALTFVHPHTAKSMRFDSPLPAQLQRLVKGK